jgi:hypothetical protein
MPHFRTSACQHRVEIGAPTISDASAIVHSRRLRCRKGRPPAVKGRVADRAVDHELIGEGVTGR